MFLALGVACQVIRFTHTLSPSPSARGNNTVGMGGLDLPIHR